MAELGAEALRIISSPYAVSLKKLDSIIRASPFDDLQCWVDANPCHIGVFASSIVRALEFCPYALPVLAKIGRIQAVRNAMLHEKRTLLETLLRNANRDGNNWEKYAPACLALLSSPLPCEFPVPALILPVFLHCVEVATKNPCTESIKDVYILVSNGHGYLAELLTPSQKSLLTDRLSGFLTTSDNAVLLLALTTMSCIGPVLDGMGSGNAANKGEETRQKGGTKDFFSGRKAVKVMNLVTNIVIDVASRDSGDLEYCLEQIRLATVIASNMTEKVKESLVDNTLNIKKLVEKIQRPGLERRALREALNYAVALYPQKSPIPALPPIVKSLSHQSIRDEAQSHSSLFLPPSMARVLGTMSSQDYISDLIRSMFIASSFPPPMTSSSYLGLRDRTQFTTSLTDLAIESQQLRTAILSSLVTNEFSRPIATFLSAHGKSPAYTCQDCEVCPAGLLRLQNELAAALCTLILRAGVYSQKDDTIGLDPSLATSLLEKQLRLSKVNHVCSALYSARPNPNSPSTVSIFETSATPEIKTNNRDWRMHLREAMLRDASQQNDVIIAEVGKICRDLEIRCEGVEKPLREEEERSEKLRQNIKDLEARLEEETEERSSLKETLEHEREEFKYKLDGENEKAREHFSRIDDLERELQIARDEASRVRSESQEALEKLNAQHKDEILRMGIESRKALEGLRSSHEAEIHQVHHSSQEALKELTASYEAERKVAQKVADTLALEHIEVLNQRQEAIEELEVHNRSLEQESDRLREALEEQRKENHETDEKIIRMDERIQIMDRELSELSLEMECQKTALGRKDNEVETLERQLRAAKSDTEDIERAMHAEITRTQEKLEHQKELIQELERRLEKTEKEARESIDHLETRKNSKVLRLKLDHEEELRKLHTKFQKTREAWATERDTQFAEKRALTKKLKQLHDWQEKKAKETANLAQQLMSTATNRDLAALLDTATDPAPTQEVQCAALSSIAPAKPPSISSMTTSTSSITSKTSSKRRTNLQDLFSETNSPQKHRNPKRTKTNPMPKTSVHGSQSQGRLDFKSVKQPNRRKTVGDLETEKENHGPELQREVAARETQTGEGDETEIDDGDGDGDVDEFGVMSLPPSSPCASTSYGGSGIFGGSIVSLPKGLGIRAGVGAMGVGVTESGRLEGDLGSEYDDTMDF
ncbi:unnamed protein product [Tuber aestivum]|uniref:Uncharacterized protein n=1 Tax=Tuber aestivum TaxID=59557 RepID=A0A292PZT5_9PEZI|nr:unnamed protein product [Tuber aestivum]